MIIQFLWSCMIRYKISLTEVIIEFKYLVISCVVIPVFQKQVLLRYFFIQISNKLVR